MTCAECGEPIAFRSGVDGPLRWYHTESGRAYCYRNPEHNETARPERD